MNDPVKKAGTFTSNDFPVKEEDVLYSSDLYALAVSKFRDQTYKSLGIRWQIEGDKPWGFPNRGSTPLWMVVPWDLAIPILAHILNTKNTKKDGVDQIDITKITKAMEELISGQDDK